MSFLNTLVVHLVLADSIDQANGHLEQKIVLVRLASFECAFSTVFLVVLIQPWLAEAEEVVVSFGASADRCSGGVTLNECPRGSNEIDLDIVELGITRFPTIIGPREQCGEVHRDSPHSVRPTTCIVAEKGCTVG